MRTTEVHIPENMGFSSDVSRYFNADNAKSYARAFLDAELHKCSQHVRRTSDTEWHSLSARSFARDWNSDEDSVYDNLL